MTAKAYQYYEVSDFPDWEEGNRFETRHQGSLFTGQVDDAPTSVITSAGLADDPSFRKYHVMHETFRSVRGRYRNEPIAGYVAQKEFHLYVHSNGGTMFVDTSGALCKEMIDRLERSDIPFLVVPRRVDLAKLADDMRTQVRGGWFGNLRVADVSSIGIFGATVGESSEWGRYEQVGSLKVVDLALDLQGQNLSVKVMAHRGVLLYRSFTESQALGLLLEIQKELDNYAIVEPDA